MNLKRIIAREGLLIVLILLLGIPLYFSGVIGNSHKKASSINPERLTTSNELIRYYFPKSIPETVVMFDYILSRRIGLSKEEEETIKNLATKREEYKNHPEWNDLEYIAWSEGSTSSNYKNLFSATEKVKHYVAIYKPLYFFSLVARPLGFILLFLTYPLYLLIRFIIWAIKTLKKQN